MRFLQYQVFDGQSTVVSCGQDSLECLVQQYRSNFDGVHHGDGLVGPHLGDCDRGALIVMSADFAVKRNGIM